MVQAVVLQRSVLPSANPVQSLKVPNKYIYLLKMLGSWCMCI